MQRIGARQQIERLKNETNFAISDVGEFIVHHRGNILAGELIMTGRRRIETTQHIHQGGFPGARRPHDREIFVAVNFEIHAPKGLNDLGAHFIELGHAFDIDHERSRRTDDARLMRPGAGSDWWRYHVFRVKDLGRIAVKSDPV